MHFHHLWLSVGFSRWSRELTSHHPHFILIAYKILFGLSCLARKAWNPGQQCPVVCGEAGWWQHVGQELFHVDMQAVPHLSWGWALLPRAWAGLTIKAFSQVTCGNAGEMCPALWYCFQLLHKEKIVRRAIHAEHSFFQNHKHSETTLLSPHLNFKNQGRIV